MTIQAGRALRRLVTDGHPSEEIVHFDVQQVFGRLATSYTCSLILDRQGKADVTVERGDTLDFWRYGTPESRNTMLAAKLTAEPWQFADAATRGLFARVYAACGRGLAKHRKSSSESKPVLMQFIYSARSAASPTP